VQLAGDPQPLLARLPPLLLLLDAALLGPHPGEHRPLLPVAPAELAGREHREQPRACHHRVPGRDRRRVLHAEVTAEQPATGDVRRHGGTREHQRRHPPALRDRGEVGGRGGQEEGTVRRAGEGVRQRRGQNDRQHRHRCPPPPGQRNRGDEQQGGPRIAELTGHVLRGRLGADHLHQGQQGGQTGAVPPRAALLPAGPGPGRAGPPVVGARRVHGTDARARRTTGASAESRARHTARGVGTPHPPHPSTPAGVRGLPSQAAGNRSRKGAVL
jgi:hypothetical protein